jgi:hypothetical protein
VVELVFGVLTLAFGLETLLAVVLGTFGALLGLETLLAVVVTPVSLEGAGAWLARGGWGGLGGGCADGWTRGCGVGWSCLGCGDA